MKSLDFRVIFRAAFSQFIIWLAMVGVVWLAGYPGVVCVTPLAWGIALRVGMVCINRSKSADSRQRLWEAALAGGLLGLLEGILFLVVIPSMGEIRADEMSGAIILSLGMFIFGIPIAAGLAAWSAYQMESRRAQAK